MPFEHSSVREDGTEATRYKRTELGVVPDDWPLLNVGDLNPFITSGSRGWARYYSDSGSPFLRITNMSRESIYLDGDDLKHVDLPTGQSEAIRTQVQQGDVLISITADIGIVSYVDGSVPKPAYINQHIALVRFNSAKTDSRFISYFLASENSQRLFRGLTDVGAKAGMSLLTIRKLRLVHPPVEEQRAITTALLDADSLIAALDQLIAKKRAIKLATMQQLLTGNRRLPSFNSTGLPDKTTELGRIPGDWHVFKIQEIGRVKTGPFGSSLHERDYVDDGTPIITVEHLSEFGIVHAELPMVSASDWNRLKAYALQNGDIVFSRVGSVDRNALVKPSEAGWLFSGRLLRIRLIRAIVDPLFLSYYFHQESFKTRIRNVAVGQTMASLNTRIARAVEVALPSLSEQLAIAKILSEMDSELIALERRRRRY
jgi:type I restriction enzyme, S subunit